MTKTKHELDEMTKDELVAYADDLDIDTQHSWLKDDIVAAILKGQKAAAKEEAKHAGQRADQPVETHVEKSAAPRAEQRGFPRADQPTDSSTKVEPKLAALQERANETQDQSTQFAADPKEARHLKEARYPKEKKHE